MVKKRTKSKKTTVAAAAEKENSEERAEPARSPGQGPMYTILSNAQQNETLHKRYVKEMQQLYSKLDHDAFMYTFIKMLKTVLETEDSNEYGNMALAFCTKFVTSFESEKTHPMLSSTFNWLLSTISNNTHIRYRICFFVNLILKQLGPCAALDDSQCDQILQYMLDRLTDISPSVRKEAVLAMQRLQVPDRSDDPVLCAYKFHMCSDPSPSVRQCVITCMGRNYYTVPHILERLWDIDEKVRRHTYLNMCSYPVRSYKVSQRLTLMEQGLNDSSENVRKTVVKYMLKQWKESYQNNLVALTAALKLDSSEEELARFKRVARQMLLVIFEQKDNAELLEQLPLSEDCELHKCVPQEELTVELVVYWQCLNEYFQEKQADEAELVLPELSVFCSYVEKYCQLQRPEMDKFAQLHFQFILHSLVEMLYAYDMGDEVGRVNLQQLIKQLLMDSLLDPKVIGVLVRCMDKLVSNVNARLQLFIEIIYEICELNAKQNDLVHDRNLINKLLDDLDSTQKMKISSLKLRILELEEQEENFVRQKEYMRAQKVNEEKLVVTEEYTELILPLLEKHGDVELPKRPKLSKQERVLKALCISFYMVASEDVKSLNPSICKLYKDFICRHLAASDKSIFEWALKCGTTFSLLYESYTKEVFEALVDQFYKDNNLRLCGTAATCVFELMDHYGVDYFVEFSQTGQQPKNHRRQLYTMQDFLDCEEDRNSSQRDDMNTDIIGMMGFFVEKVVDKDIGVAIVKGLCRLVLRGHLNDRTDVLEKLLKRYFNPNTEPMISQALGLFFENIVTSKMQSILEPCLLPILWTIMNCSYDSTFNDVLPENVTKFFIDLTVQESSTPQTNIHNKIALSFLNHIQDYYTDRKEMCRLLAKQLITLQPNVQNNAPIKGTMMELADKLCKSDLEPRMIRHLIDFKHLLDGSFNPPVRNPDGHDSEEECDSITVTTNTEITEATTAEMEVIAPPAETPTPSVEPVQQATSESVEATKESAVITEEPVLTTYGKGNEVGLANLRRSLHKSISCSDAESCRSESMPRNDREKERSMSAEKAKEITKKNLRRPQTKQRLEEALARSSKTPEKETSLTKEQVKEKEDGDDEDEEIQGTSDESTIIETEKSQDVSSGSEAIEASPTSEAPSINKTNTAAANFSRMCVHLRTVRIRNASSTNASATNVPSKQRKVLHLEVHTPLRNGRKRLLRKSPPIVIGSGTSQQISPKRKQQRMDNATPKRMQAASAKVTGSPTDSTSSSVKENESPAPAPLRTPARKKANQIVTSTPDQAQATTTRNAARLIRLNSMRVTRKRISLEMNLSTGQLKNSTPKRFQRDKSSMKPPSKAPSNNNSSQHNNSSSTRTSINHSQSSESEGKRPTRKSAPSVSKYASPAVRTTRAAAATVISTRTRRK